MKKIYVFFLLSLLVCELQAQHKYWVVFKDKPKLQVFNPTVTTSTKEISFTDIPVSRAYIDSLKHNGISPMVVSRWLNAVSVFLDTQQLDKVKRFSFVQEILPINRQIIISSTPRADFKPEYYSTVLSQVGAEAFVLRNLSGKGVKVGVIDVGFYGLTANKSLHHLIDENKIVDIKDFVNSQKTDHFTDQETNADFHGTEVMQMIAGFEPEKKLQYGLATNAAFYLARTDHGTRETRSEEDNWVAAMEHMDSLGVRLINTSLGYALGFTDARENYKPVEMDGKTSMISRATRIATEEKGMLIIVSAGNEGDDPNWKIVSTPADAEAVLSVGSTKAKSKDKISYSSIGPEFLSYLKPNVSCFSPSGTSFSAPVITGFAACLMEAVPNLTNKQLKRIIEKSGHLYPYGNNYIGYGVPNAAKALQLLTDSTLTLNKINTLRQKGNTLQVAIDNPAVERAVVFHKKNQHFVLKQELLAVVKGKLTVKRMADEQQTTIDLGNEVIEVFWEK